VTITRKTRKLELQIETDESRQTRHNSQVDRYWSRVGPSIWSMSDYRTGFPLNRTVVAQWIRTAGSLHGHSGITTDWLSTYHIYNSAYLEMSNFLMLVTPHLPRNYSLRPRWILGGFAHRLMVSCRKGIAIGNRAATTNTDRKILLSWFTLSSSALVSLWIRI
jgi:hypothetical protein